MEPVEALNVGFQEPENSRGTVDPPFQSMLNKVDSAIASIDHWPLQAAKMYEILCSPCNIQKYPLRTLYSRLRERSVISFVIAHNKNPIVPPQYFLEQDDFKAVAVLAWTYVAFPQYHETTYGTMVRIEPGSRFFNWESFLEEARKPLEGSPLRERIHDPKPKDGKKGIGIEKPAQATEAGGVSVLNRADHDTADPPIKAPKITSEELKEAEGFGYREVKQTLSYLMALGHGSVTFGPALNPRYLSIPKGVGKMAIFIHWVAFHEKLPKLFGMYFPDKITVETVAAYRAFAFCGKVFEEAQKNNQSLKDIASIYQKALILFEERNKNYHA